MGLFNKGECFVKGGQGSFAVRHFNNGYENLIEMPHFELILVLCNYVWLHLKQIFMKKEK
jgi:hypothetical protein